MIHRRAPFPGMIAPVMADAQSWIEALTFVLAKPVAPAGAPERQARLLDKLAREGTTFVEDALASLPGDPGADSARHAAVRKHRTELSRAGLAAYPRSISWL